MRKPPLLALIALVLLAGCDDDSKRSPSRSAAKPPATFPRPPTTTLRAAADQVAREGGDHVVRTQQLGRAGMVETIGGGRPLASAWILHDTGRWWPHGPGLKPPQIGTHPKRADAFRRTVERFLKGVRTGDCAAVWRQLARTGSRRGGPLSGGQARFCNNVSEGYRRRGDVFHDIARDQSARPVTLGEMRDLALYGLKLSTGRYVVFIVTRRTPHARASKFPAIWEYVQLVG